MSDNLDPTIRRGRLSSELRRARAAAELTQRQVAEDLGWSLSKLMRIENGQVGLSKTDANALLSRYGVTDDRQVRQVLTLAMSSRRQSMGAYRDVLHPEYLVFVGYESQADRLFQFEQLVIPGLLQTADYASAVIRAVARHGTPEAVLQRQIEARLARQAILRRPDPPEMSFVIDEGALRRWVGSGPGRTDILRAQLEHLRSLTRRSSITVQILPFRHGFHFGMMGPFVILEFDDVDDADVLFLETGRPNLLVRDKPDQISQYKRVFQDLQRAGSPPDSFDIEVDAILRELPQ